MTKRSENWGGSRPGAGRPRNLPIKDIQLDKAHAKTLRQVMRHYGLPYSPEAVNYHVMAWIDQEWAKIDAEYQRLADAEWNGGVL